MNHQKFKFTILALLTFVIIVHSYIDIQLATVTSSADIALNMPLTIAGVQYHVAVSLHQQDDFIVSPSAVGHKKKGKVSKKPKEATMHVWSL